MVSQLFWNHDEPIAVVPPLYVSPTPNMEKCGLRDCCYQAVALVTVREQTSGEACRLMCQPDITARNLVCSKKPRHKQDALLRGAPALVLVQCHPPRPPWMHARPQSLYASGCGGCSKCFIHEGWICCLSAYKLSPSF